jgi:UDP-N-acetylglucosamine 2-epimerase (non-hydrolysing)
MARQASTLPLILHVVGTRPNFIKAAAVFGAIDRLNRAVAAQGGSTAEQLIVHTGQHYDHAMSSVFFEELGMPVPGVNLGVGSGTHAAQTAALLVGLEKVFLETKPSIVVVYGDVNSTLAAALCAAKLGLPVVHVEAGLRSGDRTMPEEVNRVLTDRLSDLLFTTSQGADENLLREGCQRRQICRVGNVMIDSLDRILCAARERFVARKLGLAEQQYVVATLHRPSNVDDPEQLAALLEVLRALSRHGPVVFPVHVRTRASLGDGRGFGQHDRSEGLHLVKPMGYLDFVSLLADARMVLTDSGGIQAEAAAMGLPCLTARTTTEWSETVASGANRLVDPYDHEALLSEARHLYDTASGERVPCRPPLWDGHAADRLAACLADWMEVGVAT